MKYIRETSRITGQFVSLSFRPDERDAPAAKLKLVAEQKAAEAKADAIPEVAQLRDVRKVLAEVQEEINEHEARIVDYQQMLDTGNDDPGNVGDAAAFLASERESLVAARRRLASLTESACVVYDRAAGKLNTLHTVEVQKVLQSHRGIKDKRQDELIGQIENLVSELAATAGSYTAAMAYSPFVISSLIGSRPVVPNFRQLEAATT